MTHVRGSWFMFGSFDVKCAVCVCNRDGCGQQELRERVLRGKYRVPFYMSTDCEGILRRFLVLNPTKRCTLEVRRAKHTTHTSLNVCWCEIQTQLTLFFSVCLQQVMKDKWINSGYDGDDLKPHIEPVEDYSDPARIGELPLQLQQLAVHRN